MTSLAQLGLHRFETVLRSRSIINPQKVESSVTICVVLVPAYRY